MSTSWMKSIANAEVVVFGIGRTGEASFSIFGFGALLLMALRLSRLDLVFFGLSIRPLHLHQLPFELRCRARQC